MNGKPAGVRVNQAVLIMAGALFLAFVVAPQDSRFYWTPLTIGLAYLGAAIVGGRHGGHWATACALTGWGAAVVVAGAAKPDLDVSGLYLAGAGLGILAGLLLSRRGFDVSAVGLAGTISGGGLILALTTQTSGVLDNARTYAIALGVVAVANIAMAVGADRLPDPRSIQTPTSDADPSLELMHIRGEVRHD
jgi:hypothetical protein